MNETYLLYQSTSFLTILGYPFFNALIYINLYLS